MKVIKRIIKGFKRLYGRFRRVENVKKFTADFETCVWCEDETWVWAWAICEIGNEENIKIDKAKSLGAHFLTLYVAYSACYVLNSWIPFEPMVLVIFTAIFAATYFFVWFLVFAIIKATEKRLNKNLRNL